MLLAIIGPSWAEARDETGARRLDNPKDFVRIESETALARDVRVIPVLVDGARMPGEAELPEGLRGLANRQAVRLDYTRFTADAEGLVRGLQTTPTLAKHREIGSGNAGRLGSERATFFLAGLVGWALASMIGIARFGNPAQAFSGAVSVGIFAMLGGLLWNYLLNRIGVNSRIARFATSSVLGCLLAIFLVLTII